MPRIEVTPNTFKLVLPNLNSGAEVAHEADPERKPEVLSITPQMKTVLDYLTEYGEMCDEDLQELLGIEPLSRIRDNGSNPSTR